MLLLHCVAIAVVDIPLVMDERGCRTVDDGNCMDVGLVLLLTSSEDKLMVVVGERVVFVVLFFLSFCKCCCWGNLGIIFFYVVKR